MAFRERMANDAMGPDADFHGGYFVDRVGKGWRVYEYHENYSSISGNVLKRKPVRRYDPDAGNREGKYADFPTKEDAFRYIDRWLKTPPGWRAGGGWTWHA